MATPDNSNSGNGKAAPVAMPRRVVASAVQVSDVGYRKDKDLAIIDNEQKYFNASIQDVRSLTPIKAIRVLTRIDGHFSTAINNYLQLALSSGYTVTGYMAGTHQFDPAATTSALSILASMDTLYDYTKGFSIKQSLDGLLETLLKEVLQTGACMAELVLNKFTLPEYVATIDMDTIEWVSNADGSRFPRQVPKSGGNKIPLNLPTIFYASHAQGTNTIFARSPFEAALNMIYQYQGLMEDIIRVIRRTGHTRLVAKILQEAVQNNAPPEARDDPNAMAKYFESVRTEVEGVLKKLNPEDAIVAYDSVEIDSITAAGDKADYSAIIESFNGMLASSLKSMPSVLGMRMAGSQSLSNTESLLFLILAAGMRKPVETVMSRILTLAVRLAAGTDSYVKFKFKPIELRTDAELSAHRSVDLQTIMRKLSSGWLTDDEAAHLMGNFPRAPGSPNLSGTGFMDQNAATTQPKDMTTAQDGAQQKSGNAGNSNGPANPNGGGNPKG